MAVPSDQAGDGAALAAAPFHRLKDSPDGRGHALWLRAEDGIRLRAGLWRPQQAAGTVLLFPGRTEYIEKYVPIAERLADEGLATLAIDWRGQGMSDRLLSDPRPGHIADFADYQRDVLELIVAAETLRLPRPWHLLAHSMGGNIGLAALMNGLPVQTAAFSAPMLGLRHILPVQLVSGVAGTAMRFGRGGLSVLGTRGSTYLLDAPFRGNALTDDPVQWGRLVAESGSWPHLTLGGASYAWIAAAIAECRRLSSLPAPELPALIGLGSRETVVSAAAIRARAASWPQARLLELADARHELMFNSPPIADRFLAAVLRLFLG